MTKPPVHTSPHVMEPHCERCKHCGIARWQIEELGVNVCAARAAREPMESQEAVA
jgi:hypothetical protein